MQGIRRAAWCAALGGLLCPAWTQEAGKAARGDGFDGEASYEAAFEGEFSEEEFLDIAGEDEGVTLYGIRPAAPQTRVIEKSDIERRQTQDLATLLEEVLDIGITAKGAYGNKTDINIRGFNTERIGVLINGVPANDPRTGEFDVSQVDLANVERIEVIYGGSDSAYNVTGAMGGTINIITRKRQAPGWSFGGGASLTGYLTGAYNKRHSGGQTDSAHWEDLADTQKLDAFAAYGGETLSAKLGLSGANAANHYLYKDPKGFARRKESNEVRDAGANLDLAWSFSDYAVLSSITDFFYARRSFPVTGYSAGHADAEDLKLRQTANLSLPVFLREDLSTEAALDVTVTDSDYGAVIHSADQYLTAINRWGWYPLEELTLRSGLDWRFIHVDSTDNGTQTGNSGGAFLAAEYKPWKFLALTASLKGATNLADLALIPKGGIVWNVLDRDSAQMAVKGNLFRTFKFPDFDDLYRRSFDGLYTGNPDLENEDGLGGDLTVELLLGEFLNLSCSAYGQRNSNAVHWVKHGSRWRPENTVWSGFYGGDIRPALTFNLAKGPFSRLKLGVNYQLQFSYLTTQGYGYTNPVRIPYMPTHIAGGSADLEWKTGSLVMSAHWESTRYADILNQMPLDPYCLVNATLNQDIGKRLSLSANVRNALNWLYTSFAEYPMPGTSFTLSARIKIQGAGDSEEGADNGEGGYAD
jgi:vitamin B12 transporter